MEIVGRVTLRIELDPFQSNYIGRLTLDCPTVLRALESRTDKAFKTRDRAETNTAEAELAFTHNKQFQTQKVRSKIKRISCLFGWCSWHINDCRLFDDKSSLYIYIEYI